MRKALAIALVGLGVGGVIWVAKGWALKGPESKTARFNAEADNLIRSSIPGICRQLSGRQQYRHRQGPAGPDRQESADSRRAQKRPEREGRNPGSLGHPGAVLLFGKRSHDSLRRPQPDLGGQRRFKLRRPLPNRADGTVTGRPAPHPFALPRRRRGPGNGRFPAGRRPARSSAPGYFWALHFHGWRYT